MESGEWIALLFTALGTLGIGNLIARWQMRRQDEANIRNQNAQTTSTEVQTIRTVLDEVRENDRGKTEALAELRQQYLLLTDRHEQVLRRVDALEERERIALSRAAVHESWDAITFALVTPHYPNHPPPPALFADQGSLTLGAVDDNEHPGR